MQCHTHVLHPSGRQVQELLKKRRIGRLQKSMGDYSLLAGSAVDAADHYQTAADLARACNDFIWLGGAIEGIAHARVRSARRSPSVLTVSPAVSVTSRLQVNLLQLIGQQA